MTDDHQIEVTITYLEMTSASELRPKICDDPSFAIRECTVPQWQFNRFLYNTVGEAWAWRERLAWADDQWRSYTESERLRTFVAYLDGSPAGYFELQRDDEGGVEIIYFGMMPSFIGRGFGSAMLTQALAEAWQMNPRRVWVHTCTLDHPAALANYQARGMKIYKTATKLCQPKPTP